MLNLINLFQKFESFCTQIICSVLSEKYNIGEYRKSLQKLDNREKLWRAKFQSMCRQIKEIGSVVKLHNAELKDNIYARPHVITRTVGLQTNAVILCSTKVNFFVIR